MYVKYFDVSCQNIYDIEKLNLKDFVRLYRIIILLNNATFLKKFVI